MIEEYAFAKVNLTLEVLGKRADGYHQLESLVAFATDLFDVVRLEPADDVRVVATGPFSKAIAGDNLVMKAARCVADACPEMRLGVFRLDKRLPVAAGIGGGSADAAAALRAVARLNGVVQPQRRMARIAPGIGADVPVCLDSGDGAAAFMRGTGEVVWRPRRPARLLPENVFAVLVNPGVEVSTADVFRKLVAPPFAGNPATARPETGPVLTDFDAVVSLAAQSRNDLEPPAVSIAPAIGDVLDVLSAGADCRLARMSGSGATCFGLYPSRSAAGQAAEAIAMSHPHWWVRVTKLG